MKYAGRDFMEKKINLRQGINLIWETVQISREQTEDNLTPYLFIVGAGLSAPEILSANEIIEHCKEMVKDRYKNDSADWERICKESETVEANSAKYYSFWFEHAYKNKVHRQKFLKKIIKEAKISTSNLLLAQILNSKTVATTVITPNFDNQLLKSLNLIGNHNVYSTNNVLDNIVLAPQSDEVQIMHVHGTYQFYDCCNLQNEILEIANGQGLKSTAGTIEEFLKNQSPIVLGYSGWEDDVIMTKIKERLQYSMPYKLIWFCYSTKDYENLPNWLKESDDVVFVLPEEKESKKSLDNIGDKVCLPAEDVLGAIITKFKFDAPSLFSNPLQYYIEIINDFLPENLNVFPIKSWERRLNYIEHKLDDIDKKIITLDDAAARKSIVDVTVILRSIEYNFISKDDLEHIFDGVILPLLSSKNRIEDEDDLVDFLGEVISILSVRFHDIQEKKGKKYLGALLSFLSKYKKAVKKETIFDICDHIIVICNNDVFERWKLIAMGIKSDLADTNERLEMQNQIVQLGMQRIEEISIARIVLVALVKQIDNTKELKDNQWELIESIVEKHSNQKYILEAYYYSVIGFLEEGIDIGIGIDDILYEITEKELPNSLLVSAYNVKCKIEMDVSEKTKFACEAIEKIDLSSMDDCKECLDSATIIATIIDGKIELQQKVERKYINMALLICDREENCQYVCEIIVCVLCKYISVVDSDFEKQEICKRLIDICFNNRLYEEWIFVSNTYVDLLECNEKEEFYKDNENYRIYCDAREKNKMALEAYAEYDVQKCEELLLQACSTYDSLFKGEYNLPLLNIGYMVRRGEMIYNDESAMDIFNKIKWMEKDAFLCINKALLYTQMNKWAEARKEVSDIECQVVEALQWWNNEEIVGIQEKYVVLILLLLESKINRNDIDVSLELFYERCRKEIELPTEIKYEFENILSVD